MELENISESICSLNKSLRTLIACRRSVDNIWKFLCTPHKKRKSCMWSQCVWLMKKMQRDRLWLKSFDELIAKISDSSASIKNEYLIPRTHFTQDVLPPYSPSIYPWCDRSSCSPNLMFIMVGSFVHSCLMAFKKFFGEKGFTTYESAPSSIALSMSGLYDFPI